MYDRVLGELGIGRSRTSADFTEWQDFSVAAAAAAGEVTRRLHVAFVAPSRAHVDAF